MSHENIRMVYGAWQNPTRRVALPRDQVGFWGSLATRKRGPPKHWGFAGLPLPSHPGVRPTNQFHQRAGCRSTGSRSFGCRGRRRSGRHVVGQDLSERLGGIWEPTSTRSTLTTINTSFCRPLRPGPNGDVGQGIRSGHGRLRKLDRPGHNRDVFRTGFVCP